MRYACAVVALLALAAGEAAAQAIGPINITANDASGVCTTPSACADFVIGSAPALTIDVSGTWTGTLTFYAAVTTNFRVLTVTSITDLSSVSTTTASGTWTVPNVGYGVVRVRATAAMTGTAVVVARSGYLSARLAGTTPTLLQIGGATSAFPAFYRNTNTVEVKLADGSAYAGIAAKRFAVSSSGDIVLGTAAFAVAVSPTISSGFGTGPSISANNGSIAMRVNVGTGGVATTGVIGLPLAATGWNCFCSDVTTQTATVDVCKQTATSTTTATLGNFTSAGVAGAWVASDILAVSCFGY